LFRFTTQKTLELTVAIITPNELIIEIELSRIFPFNEFVEFV